MVNFSTLVAPLILLGGALAHPGEQHEHEEVRREIELRTKLASHAKRTLANCNGGVNSRALQQRAIARRAETATRLRAERGLTGTHIQHRRDLAELQAYELLSHNATSKGYTMDTDPSVIFSANTTYALTPNNTIGPYYVSGELIRQNLTEGQAGVPIHLDMQFIDITTCDPVEDLIIDVWSCNATGIYSGIDTSEGQGGLNSTYLRGVQTTDTEGVVTFDTLFPGHYTGRSTHEHVVSHINGTILPNGTYTGGTVNHIGQLFFDESLRAAIEATYPYNLNTQEVVSNDDDMWAPYGADADYDPFPEYVMLGPSLSDGLLMFITIGINTTMDFASEVSVAVFYQEDGGHVNPNATTFGSTGDAPAGNDSMSPIVERSAAPSTTAGAGSVWGFLVLTCAVAAGGSWLLM